MPQTFRLPDLGEGLTEAALVRWLVAVGDAVGIDEPIAEVETAKSIVEVPSPFAGIVTALHGAAGETLEVGAPLLEVDAAEQTPAAPAPAAAEVEVEAAVEVAAYRAEERAGSGNVLIGYGTSGTTATGRTRRPVDRSGPSGPSGPSSPAITAIAGESGGPVAVQSPLVRRLAATSRVDLRTISPSRPDGVITRRDVLGAAGRRPIVRREKLSMLRKTVGATMSRSRSEIPEATVWVDVDATELWLLRESMRVDGRTPSLTAFFAKYTLMALADHPVLGGRLSDDGTELLEFDGVDLGIATDTPRGLLVPVVDGADRLTLAELDEGVRALTEQAIAGSLAPAQLSGSTFTLNNYGSLGVDGSAAIINHPEVAILGVGRMLERPWVVGGAIVPRRVLQLSLVFDHRVCDGGYAAHFLRAIVDAIEHPTLAYSRI
ncbi:MAG TPA: dihydrolipoamide acetyltransferase family protein [Pseudolysinimonas sp.]|jgi:pyruvate dehydrogenase E2 component (dihydrolipoamide acetyltransferase)